MSPSTSCMISAYLRWAVDAILATTIEDPPSSSQAAVGWECSTKGTARRPLIHSIYKGSISQLMSKLAVVGYQLIPSMRFQCILHAVLCRHGCTTIDMQIEVNFQLRKRQCYTESTFELYQFPSSVLEAPAGLKTCHLSLCLGIVC